MGAAGLILSGAGVLLATSAASAAAPDPFGALVVVSVPGTIGSFNGVSCPDATDCTAVGQDQHDEPVYSVTSDGTWAPGVEIVAPGGGGQFNAVSCADGADCTAVGNDYNGVAIYAVETNGVWGPATELAGAGGGTTFTSVSCTDALDCTAVGQDLVTPFYATETHGVWGPVTDIPAPAGSFQAEFTSVSCGDATDCTAVGYTQDNTGAINPIYAFETNGIWGPAEEYGFGPSVVFTAVSCADASHCTAAFEDFVSDRPYYASETDGVWSFVNALPIPGGFGKIAGLSCTDASDCTAVGDDGQPVFIVENGGTWEPGQEISAPDGGFFNAVSCADATHCVAVGQDNDDEPIATVTPTLPSGGSQVHAVIEVETSPSFAGDTVHVSSSQLESSCQGTIVFETLQKGSTVAPRRSLDSVTVALDDDGNVTVVVDAANCAAGTDLIESDMTVAPYLTATTTLVVEPPQVTPSGVTAYPSTEVETGNSAASGNSDIYTVFYVETSPVYAEQPVTITSPQLDARCGQGWRWEPATGAAIDQSSGTALATGMLDNDGNAVFVFKGASCAVGESTVIADVDAGTHPTYTTTFTVAAPVPTVASALKTTKKAGKPRHRRHPKGQGGGGTATGGTTPAMTVTASPDPLVETGEAMAADTLTVVKSDNFGGTSSPPTTGYMAHYRDYVIYTITVSNSGPTALDGVTVSDPLTTDPGSDGDTYTAVGTGGASGFTSTGSGDIADRVDLPAGSTITYTATVAINFCSVD
ncbi:MAG: hypothetical protein ACRDY1_12715, partial [Acidimicrobiales bacterium]